jgi:nucleoside-diphosphate-sugar epimerase
MKLITISSIIGLCAAFAPSNNRNSAFLQKSLNAQTNESSSTSLNAKYKKVFVAGGTRGVGRNVIDKLIANGSEVVALARSDDAVAELSAIEGVTAVQGDALDYKIVEGAIDGCDAAISTLGGSTDDVAERVDYKGNNNVIEAAGILGCVRVILVTSVGCGSSKDAPPASVYEVLKDVLLLKTKAENVLIKYYTNMNWTIIRPGGLVTGSMSGNAILSEDTSTIGTIHREDVADLVVKALDSPNTERKVFAAIDPTITSAANESGATFEAYALD